MELLFQTQNLIEWGGVLLILFLVFAETGFLLGIVVPGGETLVFTAGVLASAGTFNIHLLVFFLLLALAAFLGDSAGYYIGRRFGLRLYQKEDTWYFKKRYLYLARDYVTRHKKTSLIAGKFFPLVRPFTPVIAGVTGMKKGNFFGLTAVSVLVYMAAFFFSGYFLGSRFPVIKEYLGLLLPLTVIILLVPVVIQIRKNRRKDGEEPRTGE